MDIQGPMPRTVLPPPAGGGGIPDVPNWAWHDAYMKKRPGVLFWKGEDVLDWYRATARRPDSARRLRRREGP
jgi:hypothetical protein